jgi:putative FmdB family regulatory protein
MKHAHASTGNLTSGDSELPIYEYECPACGLIEVWQSMKDKPLRKCPHCKRKIKKLVSGGVGVIFTGSGFYKTDYEKKT